MGSVIFLTHKTTEGGAIFLCDPTPSSSLAESFPRMYCNMETAGVQGQIIVPKWSERLRRVTKKGALAGFRTVVPVIPWAPQQSRWVYSFCSLWLLQTNKFCFLSSCSEKCFYHLKPNKHNIKNSKWSPPGKVVFRELTGIVCISRLYLLLDAVLSELLSSLEFAGGDKMEELISIKIWVFFLSIKRCYCGYMIECVLNSFFDNDD